MWTDRRHYHHRHLSAVRIRVVLVDGEPTRHLCPHSLPLLLDGTVPVYMFHVTLVDVLDQSKDAEDTTSVCVSCRLREDGPS